MDRVFDNYETENNAYKNVERNLKVKPIERPKHR
jgi:hypothetical protein